jgi:hypothetical protein
MASGEGRVLRQPPGEGDVQRGTGAGGLLPASASIIV